MTANKLKYQAYYTNSDSILNYMIRMLNLSDGDRILEPCGGEGAFVDKVLEKRADISMDVFELNPATVQILKEKYREEKHIRIKHTDTLLDNTVVSGSAVYDKIVGNPPYGARNDEEKKRKLGMVYPGLYIKESYTLFLYACIRCLKEGGRLCFIVPDTFLSLHRHEKLRRYLLANSKIQEISLFPSSFFPGVNFGYANLCIITLEKCSDIEVNMANIISIKTGFKDVSELGASAFINTRMLEQGKIGSNVASAFMLESENFLVELINDSSVCKVGDIARCVTGFYSGEDKKYLHPLNQEIKNAAKYQCVNRDYIRLRPLDRMESSQGIGSLDCMIPVVKGGNVPFIKESVWFMDWSIKAVQEYRSSKKCRFQNSEYYFREGLAIPMIRSSKMTAALIEKRLFDQSIVGVFPEDEKLVTYMLGFFNSSICTKIIKIINPSANNSANYIKKIPFIIPDDEIREEVENIVNEVLAKLRGKETVPDYMLDRLDKIFYAIYMECKKGKRNQKRLEPIQLVLDGMA